MVNQWIFLFYRYRNVYAPLIGILCLIAMLGYTEFVNQSTLYGLPSLKWFRGSGRSTVRGRILVTGGAGFIGFHVARKLAREGSNTVIAMDNFNDYYDIRLKIDRAYELHKIGVTVYNEDVCSEDFLEEIFVKYEITHVVHLAAQAGVRFSLKNPLAYVRANVQCQLALLNAIRDSPREIKLVYASSSSVYGKDSDIPFRLSAGTDHPGNMYAATKKTDELMGLHYCQAYGVRSVGLRFFTVYGEWGRPDMSVYKFAEAIVNGKEIPMFHVSDATPLGRDFTYIDDVIAGVISAMNYKPARCGERFNLGFGNPVSVPDMITVLQEELGMRGKVKKLPLPPTEILRTWADIRTSTKLLNFRPETNLTIGLRAFVKWFKPYIEERNKEEKSGQVPASVQWYARLVEERVERQKRYGGSFQGEKDRILSRYVHSKTKYQGRTNIAPSDERDYIEIRDVNSATIGRDLGTLHDLRERRKALKLECDSMENCVAFTESGKLLSALSPRDMWLPGNDTVYVTASVDWCRSGFSACDKNAKCIDDEKELYRCDCVAGYEGNGLQCLPVYGRVSAQELYDDNLPAYHSALNTSQAKRHADLIKYDGVDSPGGDYFIVQGSPTVDKLTKLCAEQPICIGFSTKGTLKKSIKQPDKWVKSEGASLFIYDINYCLLNEAPCPDFSECARVGQGHYRCVCQNGYIMIHGECVRPSVDRTLVPSLAQCAGSMC